MNIIVSESNYEMWPDVVDVNLFLINSYKNPIIVCSREGQKVRLNRSKQEGLHCAQVVGWWDLGGKSIQSLQEYDVVFIIDPYRIGVPSARTQWMRLIEQWT